MGGRSPPTGSPNFCIIGEQMAVLVLGVKLLVRLTFFSVFFCLSNLSAGLCVAVRLCVTQCDSSCRGSKPVSDPVTDPVDDSAYSRDSNMESDCRLQKCSQGGLFSSVER